MSEVKTCPQCNNSNPSSNKFCQYCGNNLAEVPSETALEPQQIPQPQEYPGTPLPSYPPPDKTSPVQQPGGQWQSSASGYQQAVLGLLSLDKFGIRKDNWVDLISGLGDRANAVLTGLGEELDELKKNGVTYEITDIATDKKMTNRRKCGLVKSYTGATMTVLADQYGNDLRVAWNLYQKPKINFINVGIMGGIAAFLGFFPAILTFVLEDFLAGLLIWITSALIWIIPISLLAILGGRILSGSFFALFFIEDDDFIKNDISTMKIAVHKALLRTIKLNIEEPEIEAEE